MIASVTFTSWIAARIDIERSLRTCRFTDCGICGMASDTRFCVNTLSMSWFDPTSKETLSVNVPSLALVDFM